MKQIPNIEEEKRDMELILEVLPHLILGNAEELYNNPDGEMAKNTISEMQRVIRKTHHQQLQSLHTSLVAAVEGKKYIEPQSQRAINYNRGIDDTLTTINSIFKE